MIKVEVLTNIGGYEKGYFIYIPHKHCITIQGNSYVITDTKKLSNYFPVNNTIIITYPYENIELDEEDLSEKD